MPTTKAAVKNRIKSVLAENGSGSEEAQIIRIEASTFARHTFRLTGTTPLLLGAWDEEQKRGLPDHPDKPLVKSKKERTDPEKVVSGKCYSHPEGGYALPAGMIFKCLQTAGSDFTVQGSRKSVATVIKRNLIVNGDSKDGQWVRLLADEYVIDERVGRNSGIGRTPRMIYRPRFDEWAVEVSIEYNTRWFDAHSVVNIMAIGGRTVGLGEWRPEKGGNFGRFEVSRG